MQQADTTTLRLRRSRALWVLALVLSLTACRHGRCFRDSDCRKELVCQDPDAVPTPAAARCGEGEVRCVAGCQDRCSAGSCPSGKICGESGCCEPRPCKLNNDCPGSDSCVDNVCTAPGRCMEAPSEGD